MSPLEEPRQPIDDATLKRTFIVHAQPVSVPDMGPAFPTGSTSRKPHHRRHRKGLSGVFGSRRHRDEDDDDESPPVQVQQPGFFVTTPVMHQMPDRSTRFVHDPVSVRKPTPVPVHGSTPVPPRGPTPAPRLKIHRGNELAGLIPDSPVRVVYNNKSYPTAFHLLEALKFMEHRPDIAEDIRTCITVEEARAFAVAHHEHVRPDWEQVLFEMMDEVLYHKVQEHEFLRSLLLSTGMADLVFSDMHDDFWGDGPLGRGANELGRALMRVRDCLRK